MPMMPEYLVQGWSWGNDMPAWTLLFVPFGIYFSSLLVAGLALALLVFFRRQWSAVTLHSICVVAFLVMFLTPLAGLVAPKYRIAVRSAPVTQVEEVGAGKALAPAPAMPDTVEPSDERAESRPLPGVTGKTTPATAPATKYDGKKPLPKAADPVTGARGIWSWRGWEFIGWGHLVIATFFLFLVALNHVVCFFRFLFAKKPSNAGWEQALQEARQALGVTRRIRLALSPRCSVPVAVGMIRPRVIVPPAALEWDAPKRKVALLHEVAHITRRDSLTQFLGQLTRALHWWNPLVWVLVARMRDLGERACDDLVLKVTRAPEDYAENLIEIARTFRRTHFAAAQVGIVSSSKLGARVETILDRVLVRGGLHRRFLAVTAGVALLFLLKSMLVIARVPGDAPVWSEPKKAELKKILDAVERNVSAYPNLEYSGTKVTEFWRKAENRYEAQPTPTEFAVSLMRDPDTPQFRIDYTPRVLQWINGSAPFSIQNETQFSDGETVYEVSYENRLELRPYGTWPEEGVVRLPGIQALLHYRGRRTSGPRIASKRPRSEIEHYAWLAFTGNFAGNPAQGNLLTLTEDSYHGVDAVKLEVVIRGRQRERWWLDPARGYAFLGDDLSFVHEDQWQPSYETRVVNLKEVSPGFWFPTEVRFANSTRSGIPRQRSVTKFTNVRVAADGFEEGFFTPESVLPSVRARKWGSQAARADASGEATTSIGLKLTGADDGEPLAGVTVSINRDGTDSAQVTDAEGRVEVALGNDPAAIDYLSISATPEGYVPTKLTWRRSGDALVFPERYTLRIAPASTIGGRIVDEDGQPVAGAMMRLMFANVDLGDSLTLSHVPWQPAVETDGDGRWGYQAAPEKIERLSVRLAHPDYQDDTHFGSFRHRAMQSYDTLRDGSAVLVMKEGSPISGRVLDEKGNPVSGAVVRLGRDRWGSHYPTAETDPVGNYVLAHGKVEDEMYFTVEAAGYAPGLKILRNLESGAAARCNFTLAPAQELRIRLVDEEGAPVERVRAVADTWRETRTLTFYGRSDAEGRFVWKNAPEDEVIFDLMKGDVYLRDLALRASPEEQTVVFRPALRVRGTVIDARTKKPIPEFQVMLGRVSHDDGGAIYWRTDTVQTFSDGAFERTGSHLGWRYFFRVTADGYRSEVSDGVLSEGQTVDLEFRLK